jgi:hypothetical protein
MVIGVTIQSILAILGIENRHSNIVTLTQKPGLQGLMNCLTGVGSRGLGITILIQNIA